MHEKEELAEEQGWIARMVHLFRAQSLDVQFEVGLRLRYGRDGILSQVIASTNCPETFRAGRRENALYVSCAYHCNDQAVQEVQKPRASGMGVSESVLW